jgi:hypothetical protein
VLLPEPPAVAALDVGRQEEAPGVDLVVHVHETRREPGGTV